jgi:hydroxypyruvate isomerase
MAEHLDALTAHVPQLGYTIDVGHCLQNGEDPAQVLAPRIERVRNIHMHDGRAGGGAHYALGEGELDVDGLLAVLDQAGYAGFITLETLCFPDLLRSLEVLRAAGVGAIGPLTHAA